MRSSQVFDGQASDGQSNAVQLNGERAGVFLSNDLGGGTVKIQAITPDGNTYVDVDGSAMTATGLYVLELPYVESIRLDLSGSTNPNLDAWITQ